MKGLGRARLLGAAAVAALGLSMAMAGGAMAMGQPGVSAGNECRVTASALETPGKAVEAKGAPFNPEGRAGEVYAGNPETKSLEHSNSEHAVSQYDVACVRATTHG